MKFTQEDQKDLLKRFQEDVDLFRRQQLMDYSLLLAVFEDTEIRIERKSNNKDIDDKYYNELKEKYENDKTVYISPKGYLYKLGIIDYLQEFDFMKRFEQRFKRFRFGAGKMRNISAIDYEPYALRFMHFVKHRVLQITD